MLDARKMNTVNGVFKEFAAALDFPDYFGCNGDAFRDCLTDLSWIDLECAFPRGVCIVVVAAETLLVDESSEIGWLLELLEDACKDWSVAIEVGEWWDRAAVPFHVLFHTASASSENLPTELATLPLPKQSPPF
ncbi:MAG: hypothetical protein CL946_03955 [Ectothiorhodospiraceae bacterium]|nr:hypothetical protein [Ectothiorhodospiraceae bacterium]